MASHIEQHFDLDHSSKNSPFMDTSSPSVFPYQDFPLPDYMQFPASPMYNMGVSVNFGGQSPRLPFVDSLVLPPNVHDYAYSSGASFTTGSPARPFTPPDNMPVGTGSIQPALTHLSAEELSDSMMSVPTVTATSANTITSSPQQIHTRRGSRSGAARPGSPASSSHGGAVPSTRSQMRFNPMGTGTSSSSSSVRQARPERRRRPTKEDYGSDDDDEEFQPASIGGGNSDSRREEIRRQRIESEQRRRDELRDGYRRLKDVLPISNQKSSKVSLLDRATTHIKYLEMTQQQLQTRLNQAEMETQRLRNLNEALMLSTAERHAAVVSQPQGSAF